MHVNLFLFSPLHVILISFGLYYIVNSLYFPPFMLHPLSRVTSHHLSAPVFIQRPLYCIITMVAETSNPLSYRGLVFTNIF